MKGQKTTVKELIEFLKKQPQDALVYHAEVIDGERDDDIMVAVTDVFVQDGNVMLY